VPHRGRIGGIFEPGHDDQSEEGGTGQQRRRRARREIADPAIGIGEDEGEESPEGRAIDDDAGEEPEAGMDILPVAVLLASVGLASVGLASAWEWV
jgi:hypothetical protein